LNPLAQASNPKRPRRRPSGTRPFEFAESLRFASLAASLGAKVGEIRLYAGRDQHSANAFQIGLIPRLRYMLVSDYFADHLSEPELDVVVAHELGHARGNHL